MMFCCGKCDLSYGPVRQGAEEMPKGGNAKDWFSKCLYCPPLMRTIGVAAKSYLLNNQPPLKF